MGEWVAVGAGAVVADRLALGITRGVVAAAAVAGFMTLGRRLEADVIWADAVGREAADAAAVQEEDAAECIMTAATDRAVVDAVDTAAAMAMAGRAMAADEVDTCAAASISFV